MQLVPQMQKIDAFKKERKKDKHKGKTVNFCPEKVYRKNFPLNF
jgi:hypothetical protein